MKQLKIRTFAAVMAAAMVGAPAGMNFARAAAAQDEKESEKKVADLDTELAKQMEIMDKGLKKLRRSLRKAESNAESLKTIEDVHKAAVKSRDLTPAMAAKKPEAERAKFVEGYKKEMDAVIKNLEAMQAAVKEGKNDKAQELYTALKKQEDTGHEKYTEQ
jgi:soluble cytochrome b562